VYTLVPIVDVSWKDPRRFSWDVYRAFLRLGLPVAAAEMLVAHVAVSTGWGRHADNYRLAGITAAASPQGLCLGTGVPWCDYTCATNKATGTLRAWCSYDTLDAGAAAMLALLKRRYPISLAHLIREDTTYFTSVGEEGWYEEPTSVVAPKMLAALATARTYLGAAPPASSTSVNGSLLFAAGAALLLARRYWRGWPRWLP
jgi:hypothetical protein